MVSRCPVTWGLFIGTAAITIYLKRKEEKSKIQSCSSCSSLPKCDVVFVLGAPGTGKGTQCELLVNRLKNNTKWTHLSAGDLLRAERKTADSELGKLINAKINAGELVPSSITVKLIENAMIKAYSEESCTKFLIDGFPRGRENVDSWNDAMSYHTRKFVLNFECPEEVLVGRLLERGKESGRSDDNIDVIRKRFRTHQQSTVPILQFLQQNNVPVHTIDSAKSIEQVYDSVLTYFEQENVAKVNAVKSDVRRV